MLNIIKRLFNAKKEKRALIYYGQEIDYNKIQNIDYVVVQPNHIDANDPDFALNRDNLYSYVSVGEISSKVKDYAYVKQEWIISSNAEWQSEVLDIKNPECQEFLFERVIDPIIALGFKNLFFDTLDSYNLAVKSESERKTYELALAKFIKKIHKKYPDSKLILNRGFEILEWVSSCVEAILFESYYFGLDSQPGEYKKISDADREWLDIHIAKIKELGIDAIALDYLDENNMSRAKEAIEIIRAEGMIPYVSNRNLDIYGEG